MPKMQNSSSFNRDRSQQDISEQHRMDREYQTKAAQLSKTLQAKGCQMRVKKRRTPHGIAIIPEPKEYYEYGKRYVGFPVR